MIDKLVRWLEFVCTTKGMVIALIFNGAISLLEDLSGYSGWLALFCAIISLFILPDIVTYLKKAPLD